MSQRHKVAAHTALHSRSASGVLQALAFAPHQVAAYQFLPAPTSLQSLPHRCEAYAGMLAANCPKKMPLYIASSLLTGLDCACNMPHLVYLKKPIPCPLCTPCFMHLPAPPHNLPPPPPPPPYPRQRMRQVMCTSQCSNRLSSVSAVCAAGFC